MQLYKVGAQVFEQDARGPVPSGLSIVKDPLLPVIQAGGGHRVFADRFIQTTAK
jgi:hypothetical protein